VRNERGFVVTDEFLRTSLDGVHAVGDLVTVGGAPHLQLPHVGFAEGILAAEHIAGLPVVPIDYAGVPRIAYTQPEVASVGLSETDAVEQYGPDEITSVTYDLAGNGRSAILNARGAVKLVARRNGPVLGAHLVGDRVGELIAEAQVIYSGQTSVSELARLIHPHPTQSDAIGEALLMLAGKPLHTLA
jgi:dihydrolipoamide dehydrogenase